MTYRLFDETAKLYDLHTPPDHYQHDHRFVLEELSELGPGSRVLDVGCGTGVLIDKALQAGFDPDGIDISPAMVRVAQQRVGAERVSVQAMQELTASLRYDAIVSLSWSFNYCAGLEEARELLGRFGAALRAGGKLILQLAHAPNARGVWREDREPGPDGTEDDVRFRYRFRALPGREPKLQADYGFRCESLDVDFEESHVLNAADAGKVAGQAAEAGFDPIHVYDSWARRPLADSVSAFLVGRRT